MPNKAHLLPALSHFSSAAPFLKQSLFLLMMGGVKPVEKSCRICGLGLPGPFLDLGKQPLSNSFVKPEKLDKPEPTYPLRVFYCPKCHLVQLADFTAAGEIFDEYYYFSSFSQSWLDHAKKYVDMITAKLKLGANSQVLELASNDGYLLQYFKQKNVPVLGIEPSKTVAKAAIEKGIETQVCFFSVETAERLKRENRQADLIIGNNVLAHVPDLHDFVGGMKIVLKNSGTITMEFPHLMRLMDQNQFDTVYHEHFSYFSLRVVQALFAEHGLVVYDVEELLTHGGSLRVYAAHEGQGRQASNYVRDLIGREEKAGLFKSETYAAFSKKIDSVRQGLVRFLGEAKATGKIVAGYGAPAKGNTLLNFFGLTAKDIPFTVDASPHKQGLFLPGSRIPIHAPSKIREMRPDYVLILPWNLREEISKQHAYIREWGGRFVVPIPQLEIL